MDVRVVKKTERELVLEITGEDHTLGNLIAKTAMDNDKVSYATYRIPHPLENKMEIIIVAKEGYDISSIMVEVLDDIRRSLEEFAKEVERKL